MMLSPDFGDAIIRISMAKFEMLTFLLSNPRNGRRETRPGPVTGNTTSRWPLVQTPHSSMWISRLVPAVLTRISVRRVAGHRSEGGVEISTV